MDPGSHAPSGAAGARRSSGELIFPTDDPHFWLGDNPRKERVALLTTLHKVFCRIYRWIDEAAEATGDRLQECEDSA
jgi:hypothetical protein